MATETPRNAPASKEQRDAFKASLYVAIDKICDGWDGAVEATAARGYGTGRSVTDVTGQAAQTVPQYDEYGKYVGDDSFLAAIVRDPTGNAGIRSDKAAGWIARARGALGLLLAMSSADAPGESRWTGSFYPPKLRRSLKFAASDAVDMWPINANKLFDRIHGLGNTAAANWPATPRGGQTVDGVTVGERTVELESCAWCGKPVTGGAADPIVRIDGRPHHKSTCYKRARRASDAELSAKHGTVA